MPMMRLKQEDYEKLEEMAVFETQKRQSIVPVSEVMRSVIDSEYQTFKRMLSKLEKERSKKGENPSD